MNEQERNHWEQVGKVNASGPATGLAAPGVPLSAPVNGPAYGASIRTGTGRKPGRHHRSRSTKTLTRSSAPLKRLKLTPSQARFKSV
jgi:hypothetical protein